MAIHYQITPVDTLLRVVASGFDESIQEVMSYAQAVIDAAIANESKLIFCDERDLEYRLSVHNVYDLATHAAAHARRSVKIAIVVPEKTLQDSRFYETVAVNRGMVVRMMATVEEAAAWLRVHLDP